jgi:OFA family oxalate/formate antiporter-like MFS transporter
MTPKVKNRWLIALCSVFVHMSIGSVYSWSVFKAPLHKEMGWSDMQISITFSVAIALLGLSAAFLGKLVEKKGPRVSGTIAAIFWGTGLILSGLIAIPAKSEILLYVFYGLIGGIGLGIGYITPVSSLVKWFPDRRGMATGLAIMGFGFGSLIASPIILNLIANFGIANTFTILGVFYTIIMLLASQYLAKPPVDWSPNNSQQTKSVVTTETNVKALTVGEAVKTRKFYYLWLIFFINITCGISIVSVAAPMAQDITGMSAVVSASMVGLMGLFNGLGRIGWASLSDRLGRPNTYITFFVIQILAFLLLPQITNQLLFQITLFLIITCYGGGFASVPAYLGDLFGTKELAAIHGRLLTAWAAAGVFGPLLLAWIKDTTKSYQATLYIFAGFFVIALFVAIILKREAKKLR